jgi:hypothetical protein
VQQIRSKALKALLEQVRKVVDFQRKEWHPRWRQLWEYATGRRPLIPPSLAASKDIHIYDSNLIWQTILVKNGMLTLQMPDFWVHFKRHYPNASVLAALIRSLLRFFWLKGNIQEEIRLADRYARIVGLCPVRVGYEITPSPHAAKELTGEQVAEELMGETVTLSETIWEERPVIRHVSPFRFFYDPDIPVPDLNYARWCCEVLYLTKEQLEALPYRGLDELTPTAKRSDLIGTQDREALKDIEYYEIWNVWDKDTGTRILYAPSVPDKTIQVEDIETPFPNFFPYELWTIYDIPDSPQAMGDAELLLTPVMTFNYLRTIELNFATRLLPRFFYRQGALTEQGKRALEAGSLLQGIEVASDENLNNVVLPFIPTALPQELLLVENTIREDVTTLSGVTDFHRGIPLPTKRLATEVTLLAQLSGVRGQIEQQRFDMFLSRVVSKFYHVLRHFVPEPFYVPLETPEGMTLQPVALADLPEDAEIFIVSSGGVVDRVLERREIIELFKFIAQAGLPISVWVPFVGRLLATFNIHPEEVQTVLSALKIAAAQQQLMQQAATMAQVSGVAHQALQHAQEAESASAVEGLAGAGEEEVEA